MVLHLHIPPDTYPGRILDTLKNLYHQNAFIQEYSTRVDRLETITNAIQYIQNGYVKETVSQRFQVHRSGDIFVNDETVSNLRIFFD